jgi:heme A synthase
MDAHLATNTTFLYVLLPVFVFVAALIGWLVVRAKVKYWQKTLLALGSVFAFVGFAVIALCVYFYSSTSFANTFRYYAYTALAPVSDPFKKPNASQTTLALLGVANQNGNVQLQRHPNPGYPLIVTLFTPGKFTEADLMGDVLTIPAREAGSLPRVTHTSLWWALTKNLQSVVYSAQ